MTANARNTDPVTSHQAAARTPSLRDRDRERVLKAHASNPDGLTDFELAEIVGRQQTSAGKRRGELRDVGLIEETSIRRPAPSGALAIVWRIVVPSNKVQHVLSAEQTRPHECHWPECKQQVPPAMWGCSKHWGKLPLVIRLRIWRCYKPGQETDMNPSKEYLEAARAAQDWIEKEGPL